MKTHVNIFYHYFKGWADNMKANYTPDQFRLLLCKRGFTLVELIVVCAILGVLALMAIPAFSDFKAKIKSSRTAGEIRALEKDIIAFAADNGYYPNDLDAINRGNLKDPWGNLYIYYKIPDDAHTGAYEEWGGTGFLNDDFDLYSKGADGLTAHRIEIAHNDSSDDIIRGGNGGVVELGSEW